MNNYSNILFPEIINEAFPVLDDASYIRQLASLLPLYPDTAFHLFDDKNGSFFALVMTDYPDPDNQSQELKQISGEYELSSWILSRHMPTTSTLKFVQMTISITIFSFQTRIVIIVIIWQQ